MVLPKILVLSNPPSPLSLAHRGTVRPWAPPTHRRGTPTWAPEFGGRKWVPKVRDWPSQNGVLWFRLTRHSTCTPHFNRQNELIRFRGRKIVSAPKLLEPRPRRGRPSWRLRRRLTCLLRRRDHGRGGDRQDGARALLGLCHRNCGVKQTRSWWQW